MNPANTASPATPRHLCIFLASPGDVAEERQLALQVLEQLPYDPLLRGQVTLEAVAWDKPGAGAPLLATLNPQAAIAQGLPRPANGGKFVGRDDYSTAASSEHLPKR